MLTTPAPQPNNDTATAEEQNKLAFDRLIDSLRRASLSAKEYGTRFETLVRDWLTRDGFFKTQFTQVQTFADWAREHPELSPNTNDTGIDLVGTNTEDDGFTAIQCKMYALDHRVSKEDIDSFLAASGKPCFTRRYIVATNRSWSRNVLADLAGQTVPVRVISYEELASSDVDWSAYLEGRQETIAKRTLRNYQEEAITDVMAGFTKAERGKLIMACGTGKTFTSMKLVERMFPRGALILFCMPSLALLSQTLTDWKRQCSMNMTAFAVCSDTKVGRSDPNEDTELLSLNELAMPATTKAGPLSEKVAEKLKLEGNLTVLFSTYQSLSIVSEAQKKYGLPEIDLIICDEAHRTAGGFFNSDLKENQSESSFTAVHNDTFIKAKKRLYMTATPKIYGRAPKEQASQGDLVLYSMDDESVFGRTFHTITFNEAVEKYHCLVDYKVLVLTIDESLLERDYNFIDNDVEGISVNHAAKIVGTWRALTKMDLKGEKSLTGDTDPVRRAVAFAQVIDPSAANPERISSRQFAEHYQEVIELFKQRELRYLKELKPNTQDSVYAKFHKLKIDAEHIDGSMDAAEKGQLLSWLRDEPSPDHCKILFNVRCLAEGVDVPALDAVIFLSPRRSQVEVVQTVGRVMRRSDATGKQRGYVILPVVVPTGIDPALVLNKSKQFEVVWQCLNALKSIDESFTADVNGQLGKINSDRIEVISVCGAEFSHKGAGSTRAGGSNKGRTGLKTKKQDTTDPIQTELGFERNAIIEDEIKAAIAKRVGNRHELSDWAESVGEVCQTLAVHIKKIVNDPQKTKAREALERFAAELKATLNGELTEEGIIEMLSQHVVIKPVLDELFREYAFADLNPISKAMTEVLTELDEEGMKLTVSSLETFYRDVRRRMKNIETAEDRQVLIKELFDKFFKAAFPKLRDKLGIIYTPIEIVDFMNRSVADLLKQEFGRSLGDEGLHILDPFSGTGTFLVRLMQSGLIPKDKLAYKYTHDLHANEIVPLAYYINAMNLETAYHELMPESEYAPNEVLVWTDTFADHKQGDLFKTSLAENNVRLKRETDADIRIIIGNPPYSVGQESQNDDNQNEHYEKLDNRLAETYVAKTNVTLKRSLYDSYIRAFRWASDRIGESGIIAFITNAGWIESQSADGLRKCFCEEFNSIYVYHLKGNQRTSGERSRQEGGKIFGEGSRAPVAMVFLIKNPASIEHGVVRFHAVADYLTREEKLAEVKEYGTILNPQLQLTMLTPDKHGDWLNQRDDSFGKFTSLVLEGNSFGIFNRGYPGVKTNRDVWIYNSSSQQLLKNLQRTTDAYNNAVERVKQGENIDRVISSTTDDISWTSGSKRRLEQQQRSSINTAFSDYARNSIYRPFNLQILFYDSEDACYVERPGRWNKFFPTKDSKNFVITITQSYQENFGQIALMTNLLPDFHFNGDSQCFPRYLYSSGSAENGDMFSGMDSKNSRVDAISDAALIHFQEAYGAEGQEITKDELFYYIYGILHSEDYRSRYANNLGKELPRIPRVATISDFRTFAKAGRDLADLHVNFENQTPYDGVTIENRADESNPAAYRVEQMKWGKIPGKTGNAAKDKSVLLYNEFITVRNIPLEAQEYVVNRKSALDWVVERACVSVDKKTGIVNDFNQYGEEQYHNPRYPLDLFLKVITVSLETVKIVRALPPLNLHPQDRQE
ncbi:MAG: DEAD/DEAH box helicase [Succinivibrio sp.]|nr:DEAD/DEAH box helicase [Succinivibrio sp.]